jgi:hypothetical protein
MMNIKSYAASHGLTIKKTRELCAEVLGSVPADLLDADIVKLDRALASAASSLALADSADSSSAIANSQSSQVDHAVVEIVGVKVLQKNLLLYLQTAKRHLETEKFNIDSLSFQVEQKFYSELSAYQQNTNNSSLGRMQRNANIWSSQGVRSLSGNDSEESELLESLEGLMSEFAL